MWDTLTTDSKKKKTHLILNSKKLFFFIEVIEICVYSSANLQYIKRMWKLAAAAPRILLVFFAKVDPNLGQSDDYFA
jgi:hypothetical protein